MQDKIRSATLGSIDEITKTLLDLAKAGDVSAANLLLSRTAAPVKAVAPPIEIDLTSDNPAEQVAQITRAMAAGEVPVDSGKVLIDAIGIRLQLETINVIEERLAALEQKGARR